MSSPGPALFYQVYIIFSIEINVGHSFPWCAVLALHVHSEIGALKEKEKKKTLEGIRGSFANCFTLWSSTNLIDKKMKAAD